jgi:hypothetical protein
VLQDVSSNPLLRFMSNRDESFQVVETEGSAVVPCARLIFEQPGKGRCEEQALFTRIFPDSSLDVPHRSV